MFLIIILHVFSVQITDFVPPLCEVFNVMADNCPWNVSKCGPFQWRLSANLTDGNGTGIERISLSQGTGNLTHTSLFDPVIQVTYEASCCSYIAQIAVVDKVGNVGKCYHSIVSSVALLLSCCHYHYCWSSHLTVLECSLCRLKTLMRLHVKWSVWWVVIALRI